MNNKGYTLIEVLGVIVILGVIMSIALPKIFSNNTDKTFYKTQESLAIISGKEYFNNNRNLLPKNINETIKVKLNILINNDYIKEIKDTNKENCNYEESYILVTKEKGKYKYDIRLKCKDYDTLANK